MSLRQTQSRWELFRLLRGSGFVFGCRIVGAGTTLLTQLLLARWLGAEELGVYVIAFSLAILLASASTLGFIPAAMRFIPLGQARKEPGYGRSFYAYALSRVAVFGCLLAAIAAFGVWILSGRLVNQPSVVLIALAITPVMALVQVSGGVITGYGRFALGLLPTNIIRPFVFLLLLLAVWILSYDLDASGVMYVQAAAVLLVSVPTLLFYRAFIHSQGPEIQTQDEQTWLRTGLRLLAGMLFTSYFADLVVVLAGAYLPSSEIAVLHISFRIAMLVSFGLFAVDAYIGPEIGRFHAAGDRAALATVVNHATRLRFWAAVAASVFFVAFGRQLLALFGEEFVDGYSLLLILLVGMLVQSAVGPVVRLLGISGHEDRCLKVFATALILAIALIALMTPRWGATGAAIAATLDMIFWAIWMRILVVRHVNLRPRIL